MDPLRVLHISTSDIGGGAEKAAWDLMHAYQKMGVSSWTAVGFKHSTDPSVYEIPNDQMRSRYARFWLKVGGMLNPIAQQSGIGKKLQRGIVHIGQLRRWQSLRKGYENYDYPGTWKLLELTPKNPNILHFHNLHGGYFDLTALPWLSRQVPSVMTLHDSWLLSGNCAYFYDCRRWQTGCGLCPDISIYPGIPRDQTAYNWQRKRRIFSESQVYVATPSHWLMQIVEKSILSQAVLESRVIPYGVDSEIYHPGEKKSARSSLNIPQEATILLFVAATQLRINRFKDYGTIHSAVKLVAEKMTNENILFIALGENGPSEKIGSTEIRFIPYEKDPRMIAKFYQAADMFLHAAYVDNFPFTILEALSCGLPVISTKIGGIPEQIKDGKTGYLTSPSDPVDMSHRILQLITDPILRESFGQSAAEDARIRFTLKRQVEEYINWYQDILKKI